MLNRDNQHHPLDKSTKYLLTLINRKQCLSSLRLMSRSTDRPMYSASFWKSVFVSSSVSGRILYRVVSNDICTLPDGGIANVASWSGANASGGGASEGLANGEVPS